MARPPCMNLHIQPNLADLAQSTFDYPFRILPYFSLIIRAIGVLEGIALVGNPDFAIVDEASYPYIAQAGFRCPRSQSSQSKQGLPSDFSYLIKGTSFERSLLDEGIDAVTRDQLVQIMATLGFENVIPAFSMFPTFGAINARTFSSNSNRRGQGCAR